MHSKFSSAESPQQDTGWGLIFRLNELFREIETVAPIGRYDDWNFKLDRIWINLVYRENLEIERDKDGNIIEIKFSSEDIEEKNWIDFKVKECKQQMRNYKNINNPDNPFLDKNKYLRWKKRLYDYLTLKEAWLKKLMNRNGLYIKEVSSNPAGAMWGK